jgi:hypothetical protein
VDNTYPESSQATAALVLGIVGLILCGGLLSPIAWYIGATEVRAINEGRRDPGGLQTANAGRILGIIGTVLVGLGILFFVGFLFLAIVGGVVSSS